MTSYDSAHWGEFALGQLGASAALAGLVFVALSINLRDVVQNRLLVRRAAEAVVLLSTVLFTSTAVLIPGHSRDALSVELILLGAAVCFIVGALQRGAAGGVPLVVRRVTGLGTGVLILVAGVSLGFTEGGGLYWWPAAVLLGYIGALGGGWVLLVEILR